MDDPKKTHHPLTGSTCSMDGTLETGCLMCITCKLAWQDGRLMQAWMCQWCGATEWREVPNLKPSGPGTGSADAEELSADERSEGGA